MPFWSALLRWSTSADMTLPAVWSEANMRIIFTGGAGVIGSAVIRRLLTQSAHEVLNIEMFGRGYAWLDAATHDSLIAAAHFVHPVASRQSFKIACLEKIAYARSWIDSSVVLAQVERYRGTEYAEHLLSLLDPER